MSFLAVFVVYCRGIISARLSVSIATVQIICVLPIINTYIIRDLYANIVCGRIIIYS